MRILIITHNYPVKSSERRNAGIFVHDFAKELTKSGVSVNIFCPSASSNKLKVEGIPVHWFKWGKTKKSLRELKFWKPSDILETLIFFIRGIRASIKYARQLKPDLCISMWAVPSGIFALIIKKTLGVSYAVWVLGSDIYVYSCFPIARQLINTILKNAKYIFADGIDLAHQVEKMSGKKCLLLHSGTNFSQSKKPTQEKTGKGIVLTFVGRMELEKGPDLIIDALLKLEKGVSKKLTVNFLGDGSLLPKLKDKAIKQDLSSVNFYGNIDNPDKIFKIISNSDWLIIPSRSDSIPLVFSEAMKAQTPVITASLSDLRYFVNKYKVGLLFKAGEASELAKIITALPSKKERNLFSRNTKAVAKLFSLDSTAKKFLTLIHE